jgi:hypothetical protein
VLEAGLDREVWTHGEEIPIHVSVNNNSKKTVKSVRVGFEKDDIKGRRWFEEIIADSQINKDTKYIHIVNKGKFLKDDIKGRRWFD